MEKKIDFLITWVDSNDPAWRKDFEHYSEVEGREVDKSPVRFRDWDTLRYWFRGVEKNAPWVNKIFFVTYGHLPEWLNTNNPKLAIVNHEDFIPHEYLPTYSSNVIELYFHNIKGLSDKFVFFNDDMFLIDNVSAERFFKNGLPCDIGMMACMNHASPTIFDSSVFLATALVNAHFDKKAAIQKDFWKWYSPVYPRVAINNCRFRGLKKFPGFVMNHLPQGYLKQTYDDVWSNCEEDLKRTSYNKFRTYGDVAPWLFRYWQLASGFFAPYNIFKDGKYYGVNDTSIMDISTCILRQQKRIICLNDTPIQMNYEDNKKRILSAFDVILPDKCSFER